MDDRFTWDFVRLKMDSVWMSCSQFSFNEKTGLLSVEADTMIGHTLLVDVSCKQNRTDFTLAGDHLTLQKTQMPTEGTIHSAFENRMIADAHTDLPTSVSLKIDGTPVESGQGYSCDSLSGRLVIEPGLLRGGQLFTIEANAAKRADPVTLVNAIDGLSLQEDTLTIWQAGSIVMNEHGYGLCYPSAIRLRMRDRDLSGFEFTYDLQTGRIEISENVLSTDTLTLEGTIQRANDPVELEEQLTALSLSPSQPSTWSAWSATLTADRFYGLPETVSLWMDRKPMTEESYTWSRTTGQIRISEDHMNDRMLRVAASAAPLVQPVEVKEELSHLAWSGSAPMTHTDWQITLTAHRGYLLPETVRIWLDDRELAANEFVYDSSTGALSVSHESMKADSITLQADAILDESEITLQTDLDAHVHLSGAKTIRNNHPLSRQFTLDDHFGFASQPVLTIDRHPIAQSDCSFDENTGELTIEASAMIGSSLHITLRSMLVSTGGMEIGEDTHVSIEYPDSSRAVPGKECRVILEAAPGWKLPDAIRIIDASTERELPDGFNFNPATGELTIDGIWMDENTLRIELAAIRVYDLSLLEMAVRKAETLEESRFKPSGFTLLEEEMEKGRDILGAPQSQEQIDRQAKVLNNALLALRKLPNESVLNDLSQSETASSESESAR